MGLNAVADTYTGIMLREDWDYADTLTSDFWSLEL